MLGLWRAGCGTLLRAVGLPHYRHSTADKREAEVLFELYRSTSTSHFSALLFSPFSFAGLGSALG